MRRSQVFVCQQCGHQLTKWLGRCPSCGAWGTIVEEFGNKLTSEIHAASTQATPLSEIAPDTTLRVPTDISELDQVLGGGLVPASLVLLAGEPGVGKSTLILQALESASKRTGKALYVSGEESAAQIKTRAERLGITGSRLDVAVETDLEKVLGLLAVGEYPIAAVDSIQTLADPLLDSLPGSISQVRQCAARLQVFAKEAGCSICIVGHITKEGSIAGPKVLEHIVDTVLLFEGERGYPYRILRATKNRFGSTNEIGVFEMSSAGLVPVENPSALFLSNTNEDSSGAAIVAALEGSRPLLIEVQALVSHTGFSTARRTTMGVDSQRVALLVAVLEKKLGFDLSGFDVFVNVIGGFRLAEPACDLGISVAIASSFVDLPVPRDTVLIGEVGLTGEVRQVPRLDDRLREAERLGFKQAIIPAGAHGTKPTNLELFEVRTVAEAVRKLF